MSHKPVMLESFELLIDQFTLNDLNVRFRFLSVMADHQISRDRNLKLIICFL